MRELSVLEHRASGAMNNRPQNGSRGLISEPVAVSVPAWPAQPALTLCGILSGSPHSFRHYIKDVSVPFKVLFHHMQEITILRYRGHKVIDLEPWMLPLFGFNQEKLFFNCCIQELLYCHHVIGYINSKKLIHLKATMSQTCTLIPEATNI